MVRIVFSTLTICTVLLFSGALTLARADDDSYKSLSVPFDHAASFDKPSDCGAFSHCHHDDKVKYEKPASAPHQLENSFDDNRAHTKSLSAIVADQLKPSNGR